jgi:pyrrolysyl-tRNA synthetase-like protein
MSSDKPDKSPAPRYYRKRVHLFILIDKIKLWPSRKGILHGIRSLERFGDQARVTTHCNKGFLVYNSKNSRAARWLRNKQFLGVCPQCGVPEWKLEKYNATLFKRHQGSQLLDAPAKGTEPKNPD